MAAISHQTMTDINRSSFLAADILHALSLPSQKKVTYNMFSKSSL